MSNGTYERIKIFCDTLPLKKLPWVPPETLMGVSYNWTLESGHWTLNRVVSFQLRPLESAVCTLQCTVYLNSSCGFIKYTGHTGGARAPDHNLSCSFYHHCHHIFIPFIANLSIANCLFLIAMPKVTTKDVFASKVH